MIHLLQHLGDWKRDLEPPTKLGPGEQKAGKAKKAIHGKRFPHDPVRGTAFGPDHLTGYRKHRAYAHRAVLLGFSPSRSIAWMCACLCSLTRKIINVGWLHPNLKRFKHLLDAQIVSTS